MIREQRFHEMSEIKIILTVMLSPLMDTLQDSSRERNRGDNGHCSDFGEFLGVASV